MSEQRLLPDVIFKTRVRDESLGGDNPFRWQDVTTDDIFMNKRIVFFALPGAFTPTCTNDHLPGYEKHYEEFKELRIDDVVCLSVNDAFVMYQWGKSLGIQKIFLLPDGNAEFTRKMGMLVDKSNLGFGMRSWRYSMFVQNKNIEKMFIEPEYTDNCPTDPFDISGAETMLEYLRSI
ncbi:peroxiredoxin [Nitrosomonas ureae]|uniref:Glutathione-dependent peroxiredoxin n=1 Tax=Nitrosomonas ureae TaxID=44577 RepID=A0A1H9GCD5_9PROT|nr:peroxiredoxin [Nitrosomonas ureae]SEQ47727.1 Peroxiredoxin [Nitrosomonas ureae]